MKPYGYILLTFFAVITLSQVVWSLIFGSPSYLHKVIWPIYDIVVFLLPVIGIGLLGLFCFGFGTYVLTVAFLWLLHGLSVKKFNEKHQLSYCKKVHEELEEMRILSLLSAIILNISGGLIFLLADEPEGPFAMATAYVLIFSVGYVRQKHLPAK